MQRRDVRGKKRPSQLPKRTEDYLILAICEDAQAISSPDDAENHGIGMVGVWGRCVGCGESGDSRISL
ncbi:unnamed protein product [Zymoseptoria tritici ST99CH_1A5]|uniref:Uncharacterized protein n=1 Tax=Zymoseptoria tritici ST99CH_1A5 TaxID=1276529 RepID=A0A1Y6LYD8_ZYMTR|nr:unnamed protein product [Zymoseptoria tritici ST99CH_1A5]